MNVGKKQVDFNKNEYEWDKEHRLPFRKKYTDEKRYTDEAQSLWNKAQDSKDINLDEAFDKAANLLYKAIKINSEYADAYYWLGEIYFDRKMYDAAKEAFEKAIHLNPTDEFAHLSLAEYYLSQNQPKEAIKEAEKVVEIDPENVFAPDYIKKARQLMSKGKK